MLGTTRDVSVWLAHVYTNNTQSCLPSFAASSNPPSSNSSSGSWKSETGVSVSGV